MKNRYIVLYILLLCGCGAASAQEHRTEVHIGFRVGNSTLDPSFGDNDAHLSEILSFIKNAKNDSNLELTEVSFSGSASPEGSSTLNRRLSAERLHALEEYVRQRVVIPDSIVVRQKPGIAWELLAELVEKSDMPHKDEALHVLRDVPEYIYDNQNKLVDSRKKQLMELQWGRTWHYMADHFFKPLRNACTVMMVVKQKETAPQPVEAETITPADTVVTTVAEQPAAEVITSETAEPRPFYMALKTNMLYDVLAVPNIGIEFYLGKNWSIAGNWMYGWWNKNSKQRYWRIYGGDLAVRKWFGKKASEKPLTGHHAGIYGQAFTYDFEWGGKGYMGGNPGGTLWDKTNYAAGVEYGYSLPVARRLNFDFTLGVGYWGGKYYEYIPLDGHYVWQATKNRHWFGPTKAEISLVWLLGRGNANNKKGGAK